MSDYLQSAKDDLHIGSNFSREYEDRACDLAQAQVAVWIAIAERLDALIEIGKALDDVLCEMQGHGR